MTKVAKLALVAVQVVLAAGCGELRSDSGEACLEPRNCTCDQTIFACGDVCPEGDFSADVSLTVVVSIDADESEIEKQRCWVEQTSEFELTVFAEWREQNRLVDNALMTTTSFECETPKLAAGTWTLIHGDESATFEVPSEGVVPVCVGSTALSEPPF